MLFTLVRGLGYGACALALAACSSSSATDFSSPSGGTGTGGAPPSAGGTGNAGLGGTQDNATGGQGASAGTVNGGAPSGGAGGAESGGGAGTANSGGSAGASMVGLHNGCTPGTLSDSGVLKSRFDSTKVMAGGVEYFMQVNEWNTSAAQVMTYGGAFFFKMTTQEASAMTNGGPTGFPSLFIGANSRHSTANSNLPKQVSSLTSVLTTWNWNDNGTLADATANSYNAAYDVWFSTNPMGEPNASGPSGGFLMVWLHKPADAQPIGKILYPAVTIPGVGGTWDVWIGMNGRVPCTSYVRTEDTLSLSYDLNDFIKDAVANRTNNGTAVLQNSWYLTNIFSGFEIWRGGVNLETTSFCAVVN
jgi:hypothetical protein